jgi:hypothetical protein
MRCCIFYSDVETSSVDFPVKKWNVVRSGERTGQVLGPPMPLLLTLPATVALRAGQPSCLYQIHI